MLIYKVIGSTLLLRVANARNCVAMATGGIKCHGRKLKYLSQAEAMALDQELFNEYKYSVDQLMELAGLSVAMAVARAYPPAIFQKALVICGPGNNGGDGLVAARHMALFGYEVEVYYPKRTNKTLYENLLEQCRRFGIYIVNALPPSPQDMQNRYKIIIDALFGFSFKPPVRAELKPALDSMIDSGLPVCSVDIPSGWHVEGGPTDERAIKPAMLVSLSAPKLCAQTKYICEAKHYLGGRFLPPDIIAKYDLTLPPYPGQDQIIQLSC